MGSYQRAGIKYGLCKFPWISLGEPYRNINKPSGGLQTERGSLSAAGRIGRLCVPHKGLQHFT